MPRRFPPNQLIAAIALGALVALTLLILYRGIWLGTLDAHSPPLPAALMAISAETGLWSQNPQSGSWHDPKRPALFIGAG